MANPKQLAKVQIGDPGSDSAALTDHHAFLFDKAKNLLVIPVRAVSDIPGRKRRLLQLPAAGLVRGYVFGLSRRPGLPSGGRSSTGPATTATIITAARRIDVKRSLYIGNVLYTMSAKQIKANSLDDINTTIATIPLPGREMYITRPDGHKVNTTENRITVLYPFISG